MKKRTAEILFLIQGLFVGITAGIQVYKIFSTKSAEDFVLLWIIAIFASQLMCFPLVIISKINVWLVIRILHSIVAFVLLLGVILYG